MRRATLLVLAIMLSTTSTAQESAPRLVTTQVSGVAAVATAAAVAGPWWSALIGLVSQLLTSFRGGGRVDTNTAKQAVSSNADKMNSATTLLQAWPDLLESSQQLRQNAIQLGQMVNQLSNSPDDITDNQWSDFKTQVKFVQDSYNAIYGNKTNLTILQNAADYNIVMQNANQAWNNVTAQLAHTNKTAADRKSTLQSVNGSNGSTAAITQAALLPEWWAIQEARTLSAQYQALAAQAKSAQSGKSGAPPSGTTITEYIHTPTAIPHLLSTSLSSSKARFRPVADDAAATKPVDSTDHPSLSTRALDFNKVPFWMTNSLNQTRSQYRTNWRQTLIAGLVGAGIGFMCMLLLPAIARARLAPHHAPELDILQRSLAFRSDDRSDLEQQLGALHLDVLNYVWAGTAKSDRLDFARPPGDVDSERQRRFERIQSLRNMLVTKAI